MRTIGSFRKPLRRIQRRSQKSVEHQRFIVVASSTNMVANDANTPAIEQSSTRNRRSVAEMLGEVFREAAVLLAVFIPLDLFVQGHPLTVWSMMAIVVVPSTLLSLGIVVERWRPE